MKADREPVTSAEDRSAILQVIEAERLWRDRKEWDRQLACYTEDCIVAAGWFQGSAAEFVVQSQRQAQLGDRLLGFHYTMPAGVRVRGDRALAESMSQVMVRFVVDGIELDMTAMARTLQRFRRSADGWKIAALHAVYLKDVLTPALPWERVPIAPGELDGLRPSYRMNSWMMHKLGYAPSQEMLGVDRPDEVAAFYAAAERWLSIETGRGPR